MQTNRQDLPANLIIYCSKLLDGRDMPTQLISACISIAGSSYEKISNLLEVKPASVRNALYRKTPSYEREIAKAIGVYSTYFKMHPPTQQKTRIVSPFLGLAVHLEVY